MTTRKVSLKVVPTEEHEQIRLATWLDKQGIKFYAIPNGGKRNLWEAIKFKRSGVKSGVPDICLPVPSRSSSLGQFHGLYIELKRQSGGKISDTQKFWIDFLNRNGYLAVVACGFDEARQIIINYLNLTDDMS